MRTEFIKLWKMLNPENNADQKALDFWMKNLPLSLSWLKQDQLDLVLERGFITVKCKKVNLEIFCPDNLRAKAIQNPPFQGMESVHQDDSGNTE
jgi:hypothetical protein